MRWNEIKWNEMKWNEMKWSEMPPSGTGRFLQTVEPFWRGKSHTSGDKAAGGSLTDVKSKVCRRWRGQRAPSVPQGSTWVWGPLLACYGRERKKQQIKRWVENTRYPKAKSSGDVCVRHMFCCRDLSGALSIYLQHFRGSMDELLLFFTF